MYMVVGIVRMYMVLSYVKKKCLLYLLYIYEYLGQDCDEVKEIMFVQNRQTPVWTRASPLVDLYRDGEIFQRTNPETTEDNSTLSNVNLLIVDKYTKKQKNTKKQKKTTQKKQN